MRRAILLLVPLVLAGCIPAMAEGADPFARLKPLYWDTLVVEEGKPAAEIVAPDVPEVRRLAERVRAAISRVSGAELAILPDSELANRRGELIGDAPTRNIILLGNMGISGLVSHLNYRSYSGVDARYPGRGGWVIQTVHDPWGTGANVILLGGSDLPGIALAVERFCAELPKSRTLRIPGALRFQLSPELAKSSPNLVNDLSDDEITRRLKAADTAFRGGQQGGLFPQICAAGSNYMMGGQEGQAKLFRDLIFLEDDLRRNSPATFDSPWGGAADFLFAPLISAWDNVEESPSLSDDDRRRILAILMDYIHHYEGYGYVKNLEVQSLRNNHMSFPSQGFLAAGQYFQKYYHLPEAAKWIQIADWCFQAQQKSFKPQEDCSGYQGISMRHMCRYATTRPDFTWFDSGKARIAGDLAIMTMDNLGYQASFGDVGGFNPMSQMPLWSNLTSAQRDGRYAWAFRKASLAGNKGRDVLPVPVSPVEPRDLLGVKCMPTDPLFYAVWNGRAKVPPQERTFEKLSFRASFDPEDAYLVLDGINTGYHGHWDGNSVLRMTDRGRIWLADADYIKSQPKFHNTMLVLRNGSAGTMPAFVERELAADLGAVGMSRTVTRDYGSTDWSRSIFWDKGHTFVFADELQAKETDAYSFRCCWHALGKPELSGNLFRVAQKGPLFSIRNLDGARVRWTDDPALGSNWNAYRFAEPVVRSVQQTRTQRLRAGGRVCFLNVLSTELAGESPVEAERAGDSAVLLGPAGDRALVGVRDGDEEPAPGVHTDARLYWLSGKRIALGAATYLRIGGRPVLASKSPVSVEFAGGRAVIVVESETRVAVPGEALKLDGKPVGATPEGGLVAVMIPAGRHELAGLRIPSRFALQLPEPKPARAAGSVAPASLPRSLAPVAGFAGKPGEPLSLATCDGGLYVVGADGILNALTAETKLRWRFDAGKPIRAVWAGRLSPGGPVRVAVGTADGQVHLLDDAGKPLWKQALPYYKQTPAVTYLATADLAGDGNRALIVGVESWHHYAFSADGKQLWQFEGTHVSTTGTGVDLDGDGKEEYVAGTDYYTWYALNSDGTLRWQTPRKMNGPRLNAVAAAKLDGSGKPSVLFGAADGNVYSMSAEGQKQWAFNTGDEVTGLAPADLDGDGQPEVIAASRSFSLCAIRGDGSRLWRRDLDEPILALVLADLDGDGAQELCVGTEEGRVLALDRRGNLLAQWSTHGPIRKLVAMDGGKLAVACPDGKLVVLGMQ